MGKGCCGGASCACALVDGQNSKVNGIGSSQDPFSVDLDFGLGVLDTDAFNLTLTGAGTEADPFVLSVEFAADAEFSDLPQVGNTPPSNGQVLKWNTSTNQAEWGAPTTAASGSVTHDTSLTGDGSSGTPLDVRHNADRFTATTSTGIGLTDDGINGLVRRFTNEAARTAASPAPDLDTISALDSEPGKFDYWDGSAWQPLESTWQSAADASEALALSGSYAGGRLRTYYKKISFTTDATGKFTVGDATDVGTGAGILNAQVTPLGSQVFGVLLTAVPGTLQGTAYRLDTGGVYASQPLQALVTLVIYDA